MQADDLGGVEKFQSDPHWRDYLLFYEFFHGDNGAGIGANHQTGWTDLVAKLIQMYASVTPEQIRDEGYRSLGPYQENPWPALQTRTTSGWLPC